MRLRAAFSIAALAVALSTASAHAAPQRALQVTAPPIPEGRALAALGGSAHVLLALRGGPQAERLVRAAGGRLISPQLRLWQVDGTASVSIVARLAPAGLLRYAEEDLERRSRGHLDEGDPLLEHAWHLARVGADLAEPPGPGVPLTMIDTGLDVEHSEFATVPGLVFLNAQSVPTFEDHDYHGTIVASTAAAPSDGVGTVGVYPGAALRSYDLPTLEDSDIIVALEAAVAAGPGVISLSLGGPGFSRSLYEATMRAVASGSLVVAAAGNGLLEGNVEIFPAALPHVLTVGASDLLDDPAIFSTSSPTVDVAAPGVAIPVVDPENPLLFRRFRGTSVAAPIAAAAATWIWTARPGIDATQVAELLRTTARDIGDPGFDTRSGFGIVSIPSALSAPLPPADPLEPNDDVDLVADRGVLAGSKPSLTAPGRTRASLEARLDAAEDPADVYRVFVPAGRTLVVRTEPDGDAALSLWRARTRSVHAGGAATRRDRLVTVDEEGRDGAEVLRWRNRAPHGVTVFLEAWLPKPGGWPRVAYRLVVRTV
jgi:hypothetical protein